MSEVNPLLQDDQYYDPDQVDEEDEKKVKLMEYLLPWGMEQRIAMILNVIKIPLIIIVCILGCVVEAKIATATMQTWKGGSMIKKGPTCYVHVMDMDKWYAVVNNTYIDTISDVLNGTTWWLKDRVNESLGNTTYCRDVEGALQCEIFDSAKFGLSYAIPKNMCGIKTAKSEGHRGDDVCAVADDMEKMDIDAGIGYRFPWVPHVLVWAAYKLLFLPVHPIDRVANTIDGSDPPPEPIFKLLTEPHFQKCTKCMRVLVFISKIIRYTLLPNSLIVPLLTMGSHPKCRNYFYYSYDVLLGHPVYIFLISEMVLVFSLYALGKTVYKSTCVGTWSYRAYKAYWFITGCIAVLFWIIDTIMILNLRFWEGLNLTFKAAVTFDFDFTFSIDVVQLLASMNVVLDFTSLLVMIASFICPKLFVDLGLLKQEERTVSPAPPPTASSNQASSNQADQGNRKKPGVFSLVPSAIRTKLGR